MDLDRGQCFCCNANKILVHEKPEVCEKLFVHLFGKVEFKDVKEKLLLLKWCPLCFQKLLTLLEDLDNIENLKSDSEKDECVMCRTDKYVVKIEKLPHIVKSLEELGIEGIEQICLNCIYILDVRHTIKEKICSKHPHLKARHRKTQASNELPPMSKRSKRKAAQVIEISDTEEPTIKSSITNISIFKKLKPLKYDDFFGNIEIIHSDPKFYAQIPYTKLQIYSAQNDLREKRKHETIASALNDDSPKKNIFFKIKFKSHNNKYSIVKNKHSKQKTRSNSFYSEEEELKKHNISSSLVVNLDKSTDMSLFLTDDDSKMDTSEITPENEEAVEEVDSEDKKSVTLENENTERPVEDEVDSMEEKSSGNENIEESIAIESDEEIQSAVTTANKSSQVSDENLDLVEKSDKAGNNEKSDEKLEKKTEEQLENVEDEEIKENKDELNETKSESKPKRSRPKPLSKQKKNKVERDIEEVVEEIPKPEESKKYKPGPLSRKKRRESKCVELGDDESKNLDETKCNTVEENSHLNKNDEKDTIEETADIIEESKENSEDKVVEIDESEENDKSEVKESDLEGDGNTNNDQEEKAKDEEEMSVQEDCSEEKSDKEENSEERDDKTDKTEDTTELETKEERDDKTDKTDDITEVETKEDEEELDENLKKADNEEETESKTNDIDEDKITVDLTEVENDKISSEVTNGDVEKEKLNEKKNESEDDDNDIINLDEFVDASSGEEKTSLIKRKCDDEKSEGIFSPDKKKKRVTFSDEVLESSYD